MRYGMRCAWLVAGVALLGFLPVAWAGAKRTRTPSPELLGLRIGMTDLEVRRQLEKIGTAGEMQPAEGSGRKQIWQLRDKRYETLNLRMSAKYELQWCTAYARKGKVRYSDVGDTTLARKVGRFIWVWSANATRERPAYQVTARGTDPRYASSVALSPPLSAGSSSPDITPADSIR